MKSFKTNRVITTTIRFLLSIIPIGLCIACQPELKIGNPTCEYLRNPMGIDVAQPRFSWNIISNERGVYQTSGRIIVGDNLADVKNKIGKCMDSGWQESNNTILNEYDGEELKSGRMYFWRAGAIVNGREIWSEPARFHTGMMNQDDWRAEWIGADEESIHAGTLLRNEFYVEKDVEAAYLYATAAGFYEVFMNGRKVGEDKLHPAITDYRKTILYSVYDVASLLKKGENAMGMMLGNSAYNIRKKKGRYGWGEESILGNPCVSLLLKVEYKDGGEEVFSTGKDWKYTSGPITFNNIYGGEDYDARLEEEGWTLAGFDAGRWRNVAVVESPGGKLRWQSVPIRVTETPEPTAKIHSEPGVYLFDLGQNIAGWWRITVSGKAGQTLRIRGSETLNNDLFPKNLSKGDSLNMNHAYHGRVWTDYTLNGKGTEVYEPHFFYSGFRYIEVRVNDGEDLRELKVEGRAVRSAMEQTSEWTSSNDILNRTREAGLWSQKSNTVGYPTDCPHREKGAYNGDGQVIAETAMLDFDMAPFYYKWLNDMRDSQEPNGRIPNTSPPIVGGMGGGIAWGSAYVLIPWWMYHYYDDRRILEEHYPAMQRYLDYLRRLARTDANPGEPYIVNYFDGYWYSLGEWCSPGRNDCPNHEVVNTFYYYYNAKLMSRIADVLCRRDDARRYETLSDTIKQAFMQKFFSPETCLVGLDSVYQTYQLLALVGDLVPEESRACVLETVLEDIRNRGNHLNTGIIGTKYLWSALCDSGNEDLAFDVAANETYPGYGYWIKMNCTTMLEEWGGNNSHNHQMFGSVTEFFYRCLAGIRSPAQSDDGRGYRHIVVQPVMPKGLERAKASLMTVSGRISSGWTRRNDECLFEISIPANTTATAVLPLVYERVTVAESGKTLWRDGRPVGNVSGISDARAENRRLRLSLESGDYRFVVRNE